MDIITRYIIPNTPIVINDPTLGALNKNKLQTMFYSVL